MKKLLIFLFSILISFNSYGGAKIDLSLSDFCYHQRNVQDRDGVLYFPNQQVGITATSICVYHDAYGQYYSKGRLKNGRKDGKWTWWYENGQKKREKNYKDGKLDGKDTDWHKNGQIESERTWQNGKCISEDC